MYSVLRATGTPDIQSELGAFVTAINAVRPQLADGRRREDGFTVEISSSESWEEHVRSLSSFVEAFADHVDQVRQIGAMITCDVAVQPEDRNGTDHPDHSVYFETDLLALLSTVGIRIEVTSYP